MLDTNLLEQRASSSCEKTLGKVVTLKPRPRWKDGNKRYLQEVGKEGLDWLDLTQDREK